MTTSPDPLPPAEPHGGLAGAKLPDAGPPRGEARRPAPARSAKTAPPVSAFRYGRPAGRTIDRDSGPAGQNPGYALLGYLLSGMAVYGGLGWLIARWTGVPLLFPAGLILGLGLAVWLVVIKYGRPGSG